MDDVLEAIELAKSRGVKPGESYEKELREVLAKKGKNSEPHATTDLSKEEIAKTFSKYGKKVLWIKNKGKENEPRK